MKIFKQLFLSLSFVVLSSLTIQGQEVMQAEDITPKLLKETFDAALFDVTAVEEEYIKVKDGYEYYVDIDPKKRYVTFSASYTLNPDAKAEDIYNFLNKINTEVAMIKAYTNEDLSTISYIYYFWTDGGFTAKSLVGSLKLVGSALDLCLEKDTKGVL